MSSSLTAETILENLKSEGYIVTKAQIQRWHRAGLLPSPTKRGLGRGFGTINEYPSETDTIVKAICELQQQHRRLDDITWAMWLSGGTIQPNLIKQQLRAMLEVMQEVHNELASPTGELSAETLDQLKVKRIPSGSPLKPIAKKLGHKQFQLLIADIARFFVDDQPLLPTELLEKGLRPRSNEMVPTVEMAPLDDDFFHLFKETISMRRMSAALEAMNDSQLESLRRDFLALQGIAGAFLALGGLLGLHGVYGVEEWGLVLVNSMREVEFQRFLVVGLVSLRSVLADSGSEGWIDNLGRQLEELQPVLEIADRVAREPKVAQVLTPRRIEAALRNPDSRKRLVGDLARISRHSKGDTEWQQQHP